MTQQEKRHGKRILSTILWLIIFPPIGIILLLQGWNRGLVMGMNLAASSVFALVAMFFPVAGLTYSILFGLYTFRFGVNQAIHAAKTHNPINSTSCSVHFITGIVSIIAASLIFALCPNPFIPMMVTTVIMGVLSAFYVKAAVNLETAEIDYAYDVLTFNVAEQRKFRDYEPTALSLNSVYSADIRP